MHPDVFVEWLCESVAIEVRYLRTIVPIWIELMKTNLQIAWCDVRIFVYS